MRGKGVEGCWHKQQQGNWVVSPLSGTRGVREVRAAGDGDIIDCADGVLVLPEVLRPAPGEGISARLSIPQVVKESFFYCGIVVFWYFCGIFYCRIIKKGKHHCGWCVVLLMRYLGILWGLGYPSEQVGAVLPPKFSEGGAPGLVLPVTRAIGWGDPDHCKFP